MPEWVYEEGIGETRFACISNGQIVETRIFVEGIVPAGTELVGRLRRRGFQLIAEVGKEEYLLPDGAHGVSDGAQLKIVVTRERIAGTEPWKRPLARLVHETPCVAERIPGRKIAFPAASNELNEAGWDELIEEARSGTVLFEGGELRIFPTPAMTLIDVDGALDPERLALHAAEAAASAISRLGIGGSIGIDFPTVKGKAARTSVDSAVDATLPGPFERTSLNGFGFMQIVRPRRHASLLELAQDRASFEARALLRRVAFDPAGPKRLVAHPALVTVLERNSNWIALLSRQVGGEIRLRADPNLSMSGWYAEKA